MAFVGMGSDDDGLAAGKRPLASSHKGGLRDAPPEKRQHAARVSWSLPSDADLLANHWRLTRKQTGAWMNRALSVHDLRLTDGFTDKATGETVLWLPNGKPTTEWTAKQWVDLLRHWNLLSMTYFDAVPQGEGETTRSHGA